MANLPNVVITDKNPGKGLRTVYDCQAEGWADVLVWPDLDVAKYDLETLGERSHAVILVTKPENTTRAESTAHELDGLGTKSQAYAVESGNPFKGVFSSGGRPVIDSGGGEENTGPSSRKKAKPAPPPVEVKTSKWLDAQEFPPLKWVTPGLVPEGYTILAGPPKLGKSWLVLALALAVATPGGRAFGKIDTGPARPVLYLGLEDSDRRLQSRSRAILGPGVTLPNYTYILSGTCDQLLDAVKTFLDDHGDEAPLIVVDTVAKMRMGEKKERGENSYEADYAFGSVLHDLVSERPGASLLGVFHRKKGADGGDYVEAVSGSSGITGSADTVLVLSRSREETHGTLHVTGREIGEASYSVVNEGQGWKLDGSTLEEAAAAVSERRESEKLGGTSGQVLSAAQTQPGDFRAADLAEHVPDMSTDSIRKSLNNLTRGANPRIVRGQGRGTFRYSGARVLKFPAGRDEDDDAGGGVCVSC